MKLAKREKLFIGAAAGILGAFLILQLLVFPFFARKNRLAKETDTMEKIIKDMERLGVGGQDTGISGSLEKVLSTRKNTLTEIVREEYEALGLTKENIGNLGPGRGKTLNGYQEDITEVEFKAITLSQLKEFLFRIRKPEKFIFTKGIYIKHNKKEEGYLDANVTVMSYKFESPE